MKIFVILFVIACSTLVLGAPKSSDREKDANEDDLRSEYCDFPPSSPFMRECADFRCNKDGTRVLHIPCLYSTCPHKVSNDEIVKSFPECCPPLSC